MGSVGRTPSTLHPESDIEPQSAQSSLRVWIRTPGFTRSAFSVVSVAMTASVLKLQAEMEPPDCGLRPRTQQLPARLGSRPAEQPTGQRMEQLGSRPAPLSAE